MSVASARVGRGVPIIESQTRVMIAGLPRIAHAVHIAFCTIAIFSGCTSRPRLPRETTTPSAAYAIDRKLSSAWRVSTLATSLVASQPIESRNSRASSTSSTERQ